MSNENLKLIVGLGNPGAKYDGTRHNIGFAVLDEFARKYGFEFRNEKKFYSLIAMRDVELNYTKRNREIIKLETGDLEADATHGAFFTPPSYEKKITFDNFRKQTKLILLKPQTYMNESGKAVQEVLNFYKINFSNMLVVHDDVSLYTGKQKIVFNQRSGGQHGVEDIMEKHGLRIDFHRLKIGVGPDPGGDQRANYVLAKFPKDQEEQVTKLIDESVLLIAKWICDDDAQQIREITIS
jgi:peptidyl-tRNA hydrolase, PTH1 family